MPRAATIHHELRAPCRLTVAFEVQGGFSTTGLTPPDELNRVPRTIFDDPEGESFYDQIAWFRGDQGVPLLSLDYVSSGTFDFANGMIPFTSRTGLSWHISDHYPLWVEFSTRAGRGGP